MKGKQRKRERRRERQRSRKEHEMFNKSEGKTTVLAIFDQDKVPHILITPLAMAKMEAYVSQCDKEISWLGFVEKTGDTTYTIEDVCLVEQDVTAATANLCEKALSAFGTKLVQEGRIDLFNKVRMWGHSHVNMGVFASGTDADTFADFYENCEYFIRLICNKKGEVSIDVMDCDANLQYNNVKWEIVASPMMAQIQALIALYEKENAVLEAEVKTFVEAEIKLAIKQPAPYSWQNRTTIYDTSPAKIWGVRVDGQWINHIDKLDLVFDPSEVVYFAALDDGREVWTECQSYSYMKHLSVKECTYLYDLCKEACAKFNYTFETVMSPDDDETFCDICGEELVDGKCLTCESVGIMQAGVV